VFATAPTTATDATAAAAASPTVAQELFPRAAIEPTAELQGDQILATQRQWIHQAGTASEPITEAATPWLDRPIRQEQAIQTGAGGMNAAPGTTIGELVPSLEVEVVEEPELMEVAQADPSLAEELEIELTPIRKRRASQRGDGTATQELEPPAPADSLEEPDDLMEDPELLAGLLRVVVTP
jgi:cytochrome c5